ncbi:MAG: hypothetical protein ACJAS1_003739 [Oleiphilaceae bacterium]|jgi:hypothetical protein
MIEWLVACLYTLSGLLFLLSVRFLFSLVILSWWLPFKLLKLLIYVSLSTFIFISANQISSFYISDVGTRIAEIDIRYQNKQNYVVTLITPGQPTNKYKFEISGDDWQLDLKLITWHSLLAKVGIDTLYRLERIGGRYHTIDNELNAKRSIYQLNEDKISDQLWAYISSFSEGLIFRASYGSGLYGPMSDKAKYGVFLTATGAEVLPLNDSAKKALNEW